MVRNGEPDDCRRLDRSSPDDWTGQVNAILDDASMSDAEKQAALDDLGAQVKRAGEVAGDGDDRGTA